jgi:RNA-binding protein 25
MPWPPGGSAAPLPGVAPPPPAKTTVYIGKISPLVDDDLMRRVLEACGEVRRCAFARARPLHGATLMGGARFDVHAFNKSARAAHASARAAPRSWKRSTDPETGAPKRFGFVEFVHADGVLRALRVLRERPLAGSEPLLVNVSSETQRFLDYHVALQKSRRATIVAAPQLNRVPDDAGDAQGKPADSSAAAATAAADDASQEEALDKAALSAVQARARLLARALRRSCRGV